MHACAEDARADAVRGLKLGGASAGVDVKDNTSLTWRAESGVGRAEGRMLEVGG